MSKLVLELTPNLQKGVSQINECSEKLGVVLGRIVSKLHLRDERAFSAEEEQSLADVLGIGEESVALVIETASYLFQEAAYHAASPDTFAAQLSLVGVASADVFAKVWKKNGGAVVGEMRERSLCPTVAEGTNWRLNLQMAQMSQAKMKIPMAQIELKTSGENTLLEFTHDELVDFYNQLETVQEQLDQLS